jgi:hypothetical protein
MGALWGKKIQTEDWHALSYNETEETTAHSFPCDRLTETLDASGSAILSTSYFRPRCATASLFAFETYLSIGVISMFSSE